MPRLLLLLPQSPFDPASGAPKATRTIAAWLARAGWEVRGLSVSLSAAADAPAPAEALRGLGFAVTVATPNRAVYAHDRPVLEFVDADGIRHRMLDLPERRLAAGAGWQESHGGQFNRLFQRELTERRPDVVLTYGGQPGDVERLRRARAAGCKVVFALHNHAYCGARWLLECDDVLAPSAYLAGVYAAALGLRATALPSPFDLEEVVAPAREPIFFGAINPDIPKGACLLARVAEEVGVRRPDLPMLFIESRGTAGTLIEAGLAAGFDLRRHENLMFAPGVSRTADLFGAMRALLVPSVSPESFGRVAAEALLNGVPPLVSDRGGLPEAAAGGGVVLPLPATLTVETRAAVSAEDARPWLEAIERLAEDAAYAEASARAAEAGRVYRPEVLRPRYLAHFSAVAAR